MKRMHDITLQLSMLRRYVALHGRGVRSHARSRSAIPTAIRRSLMAATSQFVEATWSGDPPQHVQHGHAGALHAVLLPCNLRGSLQRELSSGYEQTVHVFNLLFFTLLKKKSSSNIY